MLSQKQRGACHKVGIFFYMVHFGKVLQAYAVVLRYGVQRFACLHGVGVVAHGGFVLFLLNPDGFAWGYSLFFVEVVEFCKFAVLDV